MSVLQNGGNAFDAAVAAAFSFYMAEPGFNGLGGEAVILATRAGSDGVNAIVGLGAAPVSATPGNYKSLGLDSVPSRGLLAATAPGAFDAWMLLLRDYGTFSLERCLLPTINYAERGIPLSASTIGLIAKRQDIFLKTWHGNAELFLRNGELPAPRELYKNPAFSKTLRRLIKEAESVRGSREMQIEKARDAFYRGFVAEEVMVFLDNAFSTDTTDPEANRGFIASTDFCSVEGEIEPALSAPFGDYELFKPGPLTQGPTFLQHLRYMDLTGIQQATEIDSNFIKSYMDGAITAYTDRNRSVGDPRFIPDVTAKLLSDQYIEALIGNSVGERLRSGLVGDIEEPAGVAARSGDTVHFDIVDRWGNMVSATPSGGWFQDSPIIPKLGFCLGTRAQVFTMNSEDANLLVPGKRPRVTLSPTIAYKAGLPYMAFGAPGGDHQDQYSLLYFLYHTILKLTPQDATEAPIFQSEEARSSFPPFRQHPGLVRVEKRMDDIARVLKMNGYRISLLQNYSNSLVSSVLKESEFVLAAASPSLSCAYAMAY
jgi:gamma-glutamyltranspeptidase/glutathione hydrolase